MELHIYLKSKKLSREEFAESIGVSPMTVWRYLNGQRKPTDEAMMRIFKVTDGAVDANSFHKFPPIKKPKPPCNHLTPASPS